MTWLGQILKKCVKKYNLLTVTIIKLFVIVLQQDQQVNLMVVKGNINGYLKVLKLKELVHIMHLIAMWIGFNGKRHMKQKNDRKKKKQRKMSKRVPENDNTMLLNCSRINSINCTMCDCFKLCMLLHYSLTEISFNISHFFIYHVIWHDQVFSLASDLCFT